MGRGGAHDSVISLEEDLERSIYASSGGFEAVYICIYMFDKLQSITR